MSKTDYRKLNNKNCASFSELSKLIIDAIESEQFFNKEELIPKVKSIISAFKINIASAKYNRIETPSDAAKRIRSLEKCDVELVFWRSKIKEIVGEEQMGDLYNEHDNYLSEKGF